MIHTISPKGKESRIVYMGTPAFAVEPLKSIFNAGFNVIGVVTAPDKPAGRGQRLKPSPVKEYAISQGLAVHQPEKLKDPLFIDALKNLNPDIIVVVAFRMLPEVIWRIPTLGTFNLHASLLPQYRGAAPINWAIINGEGKTGVTTFLIDHEIDTGPILLRKEAEISSNETAGALHDKLMVLGAELVIDTIQLLGAGSYAAIPQQKQIFRSESLKPAPKIYRDTCRIDWSRPAEQLHNLIRGLSPHPGAWCELTLSNGETHQAKLLKSRFIGNNAITSRCSIETDGHSFLKISCVGGILDILELQLAGKRAMTTPEFLRGLHQSLPLRVS